MIGLVEQTDGRSAGEMIGVDGCSADFLHVENAHLFIIMEEDQRRVADEIGEGGIIAVDVKAECVNFLRRSNRGTCLIQVPRCNVCRRKFFVQVNDFVCSHVSRPLRCHRDKLEGQTVPVRLFVCLYDKIVLSGGHVGVKRKRFLPVG